MGRCAEVLRSATAHRQLVTTNEITFQEVSFNLGAYCVEVAAEEVSK
jgi:hypothetical protein